MTPESIFHHAETSADIVDEVLARPEMRLSDQLKCLIMRLGIKPSGLARLSGIDPGLLNRVLNRKDRRGLGKRQVDDIVDGIAFDFEDVSARERAGWQRALQCTASAERSVRRMLPEGISENSEMARRALSELVVAHWRIWEDTNGQMPMAAPDIKPPDGVIVLDESLQKVLAPSSLTFLKVFLFGSSISRAADEAGISVREGVEVIFAVKEALKVRSVAELRAVFIDAWQRQD